MKIFDSNMPENHWNSEWNDKVNFVDENNVVLGYDMSQRCCENAGWFISESVQQTVLENLYIPNVTNYKFDTNFFEELEFDENKDKSGVLIIFRLVSGKKSLYLHLYNAHNGYYSHGFNLNVGGERIRDDTI